MAIEGVGLYYTLQCNAACEHCGVWSSPDRRERMSLDQASRYLNDLKRLWDIKVVVFVGGEPLLHLDDICLLIEQARSLGIVTQVSTNAFWAGTDDKAYATLQKLVTAGLGHLALSADSYHSPFIDPGNVGRALRVAREFKLVRKLQVINSSVNPEDNIPEVVGIDRAECRDQKYFKQHRNDPGFDAGKYIIVTRHAVVPFGRGAFLKDHAPVLSLDELDDWPCWMVRKFPMIYPNGDTYACCCIAGFYQPYLIGNLDRHDAEEMSRRMFDDPVFEAIATVGPVTLARSCRADGVSFSEAFGNECHACREMFGKVERPALEAKARGLLMLRSLAGKQNEYFDDFI